ncbi:MAG: sigma-70 family RNA polymerase sigma factor [Planctomycetota bacterium]
MADEQGHSVDGSDDFRTELFISLISANHHRIYAFIISLLPNNADADDMMQETSRVLWEKFDQFTPGTDFVAWAVTVAKYQILNFLKKKKTTVSLSRETIDLISKDSKKVLNQSAKRFTALRECVAKLDDKGLMFLRMRYRNGFSARIIAQRVGASIKVVYRNESRIHAFLMRCIQRTLAGRDAL